MEGIVLKGTMEEICAILKAESWRCDGISVATYSKLKRVESAESKQFGENYLGVIYGMEKN